MRRFTLYSSLVFLFALMVSSVSVYAATDGNISFTSSVGTKNISITIPRLIKITGVDDVTFGSYGGSGNQEDTDSLCIFITSGNYDITATGSGDGGTTFEVEDGANDIAYNVFWADDNVTLIGAATQLTHGSALGSQTGGNAINLITSCTGNENARVFVQMLEADLQAAPDGTYTGTLTLTVSPV